MRLLESAIVRARVVSTFRPAAMPGATDPPITLEYEQFERGYTDLAADEPRALAIGVRRRDDGRYLLDFTWLHDGEPWSFMAPVPFGAAELTRHLGDVRRAFLRLTTESAYATTLEIGEGDRVAALRQVAEVGRDLYVALFLRQRDSAIAGIGRRLSQVRLPAGAVVEVTVKDDASDFLFPWHLLYDAELPDDPAQPPDVNGFWGARYIVEQRLPETGWTTVTQRVQGPRQLTTLFWERFSNARQHAESLAALACPTLEISTPPIGRASKARTVLRQTLRPADVLYFYTHAHTRQPGSDTVALITDAIRTERSGTPGATTLTRLWQRMSAAADEPSWIKLTHGRLALTDLYADRDINLPSGPLVILNACESVQITPHLTGESFVHFFLDRGARSVLGTECVMTTHFAKPFAERLLGLLRDGAPVGSAVLTTRQAFLAAGNPLALAYTLYGSADYRLGEPPRGDGRPAERTGGRT
jgi:hypothetical protein